MGTKIEEDLFENVEANAETTKGDEIGKAVRIIVSPENIDQKGRLTKAQIRGIIKVDALNTYLHGKFGKRAFTRSGKAEYVENRVLGLMVERVKVLPISINGKGREELIKIVEGLGITLHDDTLSMRDRLLRR